MVARRWILAMQLSRGRILCNSYIVEVTEVYASAGGSAGVLLRIFWRSHDTAAL
jgi:hypothetical protein